MPSRHHENHREQGSVTATTLVFPVLLLLVLLVVQFALAYHAKTIVTAAAQDAARATERNAGDLAAGRAAAQQVLDDDARNLLGHSRIDVTVDAGDNVTARVTAQVTALIPIPGLRLEVSGRAGGPTERFRPEGRRP